jgi:hypothetical protein
MSTILRPVNRNLVSFGELALSSKKHRYLNFLNYYLNLYQYHC